MTSWTPPPSGGPRSAGCARCSTRRRSCTDTTKTLVRGGGEEGIAWLRMIFPGPDSPGREGLGKDNEAGVSLLILCTSGGGTTMALWTPLWSGPHSADCARYHVHGHFEDFGEWWKTGGQWLAEHISWARQLWPRGLKPG